jgi:hypothetical protein
MHHERDKMLVRFLVYCSVAGSARHSHFTGHHWTSSDALSRLRPTKTYASRTFDIPCRLAEQLRDYRSKSSTGDIAPLVFPNAKGGYLQFKNWRRYWDPATEQAGSALYHTTFESLAFLCSSTQVHHPKTFSCTWTTHRSR